MRFPSWLYQLLPGDQGSQQLEAIWREAAIAANLTTVGGTVYAVPSDKCLVLTNLVYRSDVPAGATLSRIRMIADPPAGPTRYDIAENETNLVGANARSDLWQGEVVIPGGWKVRVEGNFSVADPGNTVTCELFGYQIPRGTFVFG